jgi:hypothetical protein
VVHILRHRLHSFHIRHHRHIKGEDTVIAVLADKNRQVDNSLNAYI